MRGMMENITTRIPGGGHTYMMNGSCMKIYNQSSKESQRVMQVFLYATGLCDWQRFGPKT